MKLSVIDELIKQCRELLAFYKEMNINKDKLIFQLPATWPGIQACKILEREGINTLIEHIFRYYYRFKMRD